MRRITAHGGHFGGSLDAVAIGLLEAPKTWHVIEFKTHGTKSFASLKKDGVEGSKPQHWAQMQVYMHLTGIARPLYVAIGKDTDEFHIERLRADPAAAERLLAKARRIIDAPMPPARISVGPTWWQCRLQELAYGGLSVRAEAKLDTLIEEKDRRLKGKLPVRKADRPITGTRLIRRWQGVDHCVTVREDGYGYRGAKYASPRRSRR